LFYQQGIYKRKKRDERGITGKRNISFFSRVKNIEREKGKRLFLEQLRDDRNGD